MTIKERIQEVLKERNISSVKLEQELGFGKGYISKLDKASPSAENILKIANYLHISTDYIIGKTDDSFVKIEGLPNYVFNAATGTLIPSKKNQDPAAVDFLRNQNTIKLSEDAIDVAAQYATRPPEIQEMIRNLLKLSEPRS